MFKTLGCVAFIITFSNNENFEIPVKSSTCVWLMVYEYRNWVRRRVTSFDTSVCVSSQMFYSTTDGWTTLPTVRMENPNFHATKHKNIVWSVPPRGGRPGSARVFEFRFTNDTAYCERLTVSAENTETRGWAVFFFKLHVKK